MAQNKRMERMNRKTVGWEGIEEKERRNARPNGNNGIHTVKQVLKEMIGFMPLCVFFCAVFFLACNGRNSSFFFFLQLFLFLFFGMAMHARLSARLNFGVVCNGWRSPCIYIEGTRENMCKIARRTYTYNMKTRLPLRFLLVWMSIYLSIHARTRTHRHKHTRYTMSTKHVHGFVFATTFIVVLLAVVLSF